MNKVILILKKILNRILQYPESYKSSLFTGTSRGLSNVNFEGKNGVPDRCNFAGEIFLGYATTLGYNNVLHGNIKIGKYCQLGFDVAMHSTNHPNNNMTTYINNNLFSGELKALKEIKKIDIGNDVWIGHNAMIIGDVKIGNGVIIAAGAIVTKDVPSYCIVAGVPATIIKMRFNDNIIQELETLKWWEKDEKELEKLKPLFFKDFSQLNSIYEEVK